MNYNKKIINFWKNDNLKNITAGKTEFPEGWDVKTLISELINNDDVIEVGCGYGRLVESFMPEQYSGVDINSHAIQEAKRINPKYNFSNFNVDDELNDSTWLMFYTVLLHVSDDDILPYLKSVTKNTKKVLVAEILGEKWRGWEFAFNREEKTYEELFNECGFKKTQKIDKEYVHYKNTNITFMVFEKI